MKCMKHSALVMAICTLSACGGGGGGGGSVPVAVVPPPVPVVTNQSSGGIWTAQYTVPSGTNAGDVIDFEGLVSENGQFFGYSKNTTNGCAALGFGQFSVSANNVMGSETFLLVQYSTIPGVTTNCVEPDGSTSGTGSITGTVAQRSSLTLSSTETTSKGSSLPSSTTTWTYSSLYSNPSSLAAIAGNYNDNGATLNISGSGVIFEQDSNGCVVLGQVSIIDASYNNYAVQVSFSNCGTIPNGTSASGLVTLDTSVSPTNLIGGVTGNIGGAIYALAFEAPKM
jgi:hypothetical protein